MITEKNNVFYCDCGFSFQRGRSGAHDCADGLRNQLAESEAKCAALAAESSGMSAFVDALLCIAWQGGSADGAEIQELALKHGLLRQEIYSADKHENQVDDPGNFEDGDPVYFRVETPAADAFLAEVRASGVGTLSNADQSVIAERQRQQSAEGWTPEHDDQYGESQLLWASSCYVLNTIQPFNRIPLDWPWAPEWWKPTNPRRDLVKAGALILAEIERIDRAAAGKGE